MPLSERAKTATINALLSDESLFEKVVGELKKHTVTVDYEILRQCSIRLRNIREAIEEICGEHEGR